MHLYYPETISPVSSTWKKSFLRSQSLVQRDWAPLIYTMIYKLVTVLYTKDTLKTNADKMELTKQCAK